MSPQISGSGTYWPIHSPYHLFGTDHKNPWHHSAICCLQGTLQIHYLIYILQETSEVRWGRFIAILWTRSWGSKKLNNLPKGTRLLGSRARMGIQFSWLLMQYAFFMLPSFSHTSLSISYCFGIFWYCSLIHMKVPCSLCFTNISSKPMIMPAT